MARGYVVVFLMATSFVSNAEAACPNPIPDSIDGATLRECMREFQTTIANPPNVDTSGLAAALDDAKREIKSLEEKIAKLEGRPVSLSENQVREIAAESAVPSRIVVASISKCGDLPGSWSPYEHGYGRFIVGAGKPTEKQYQTSDYPYWYPAHLAKSNENRKKLSVYEAETPGGEEMHTLTIAEMPLHDHAAKIEIDSSTNEWRQDDNRTEYPMLGAFSDAGGNVHGIRDNPHSHDISIETAGSSNYHNNMPPFIALHFCTKD